MFKVKVFNENGKVVGACVFSKREEAWKYAETMSIIHYSATVLEEKENEFMSTERIIKTIVEEVKNKGFNVEHKQTSKNGVELNGLALFCDDTVACIVYVDDSVKQIQEKKTTLEKVVEEVVESLEKAKDRQPKMNEFMDFRYILDNLYIGLQRRTSETLVKKIYKDFEDYEAYLYISKFTDEQSMSAKVTPYWLEQLGITERKAWELAEENTFASTKIKSALEQLMELMDMPYDGSIDDGKMYVLTNEKNYKGAAGVLDKQRLKEFATKHNTKQLVIIPSSIHEVLILIPDKNDFTEDELATMIREVNTEQVEPVEQLGDKPVILNF